MYKTLRKFNRSIFNQRFKILFYHLKKIGKIKEFDEAFYAQFDGMLYNMIPVDYYLKTMSMGKCFDASAVLALAMGKTDDVFVARGNLAFAGLSIDGTTNFVHGWVEKDGYVYDTTWQIIMPKKLYYRLFGAKCTDLRSAKVFFEDCKELSDFNIHDKAFYENNYSPFAYPSLIQMMNCGKFDTMNKHSEARRKLGEKLLKDLPDIDKVYEQYKLATDFSQIENA